MADIGLRWVHATSIIEAVHVTSLHHGRLRPPSVGGVTGDDWGSEESGGGGGTKENRLYP